MDKESPKKTQKVKHYALQAFYIFDSVTFIATFTRVDIIATGINMIINHFFIRV